MTGWKGGRKREERGAKGGTGHSQGILTAWENNRQRDEREEREKTEEQGDKDKRDLVLKEKLKLNLKS